MVMMDLLLSLLIILLSSSLCFLVFGHLAWMIKKTSMKGSGESVPEATGSWPIIGHLHLFSGSRALHRILGSMADKFGPIFTIKVGLHRVLVVSNSEMAKECLTTNDRVFASRPKSMARELMGYNYAMFAFAPYGSYWREMRKIVVQELASHRYVQMLAHVKVSELNLSVIDMYTNWMKNKGKSEMVMIDMKEWFGNLIMNMTVRVLFGYQFSLDKQNADQVKKPVRRFTELMGAIVPSDVIPGLRWLDIGGYEMEMKKTAKEMDAIVDGWLQEHKKKTDDSKDYDFMTALLSRVKEELKQDFYEYDIDTIVKSTCLAILTAASGTTTVTLTWALALLVNNPLVLHKAQQEIEAHVGKDRRLEESDLKNLVYLQAIIKETMRLYPAAPFPVPHLSTEDCIVGGYTVPKGTQLLLNLWKIQHDATIWNDPFEFQPETFLTCRKEVDVRGQHFELIPFGSGRRICPGISFALDAVQFILANIIHGFEFRNPTNEQIDMTEGTGMTIVKATPLELLVAPKLLPHLYGESR